MSQVLKRAAVERAPKPRPEVSREGVREARGFGPLARIEPRSPVRRPIDLERRARFGRIEEDDASSDQ